MSKQIKQMEMDALSRAFEGVRDLVALSVSGLDARAENQVRLTLRRKNIRLQMVQNSLARRVFDHMGLRATAIWEGPTTIAWGGSSLSELSRELESQFKKNEKVKFKGAVADGQEVTFEQAIFWPTRAEALGRVVLLLLSPAARVAGALRGPAGRVAGQVKSLAEKPEGAPAEAAAAPTA
jgi:large subunit ribosomal protein L10